MQYYFNNNYFGLLFIIIAIIIIVTGNHGPSKPNNKLNCILMMFISK